MNELSLEAESVDSKLANAAEVRPGIRQRSGLTYFMFEHAEVYHIVPFTIVPQCFSITTLLDEAYLTIQLDGVGVSVIYDNRDSM